MANYQVRRMTRQEVDGAVEWAAREGWNPGLHDADCFWAIDPDGFFIGELNGQRVACGSALCYDDRFAFCGFYIVAPDHRGEGLGLQLTKARLEHVGPRNAGLDGVLTMVDRYARLGYRPAHTTTRYSFTPTLPYPEPTGLQPASEVSFADLLSYDTRHFFAPRERFLQLWLAQTGSRALVAVEGSRLVGYGVIRPCRESHKIGPLFADTAEVATALLGALSNHGRGSPVYLDVPEPNAAGVALTRQFGMTPGFACLRMYLRGDPGLPLDRIYGITSFEAG